MATPQQTAHLSLRGLHIGDAFGQQFFQDEAWLEEYLAPRRLPDTEWYYTDDTMMAMSIYRNLVVHGKIDQDDLARCFAQHYHPLRGYGPAMHRLLQEVQIGQHWHQLSRGQFDGTGSFGNGAAMRVAPLGAYFQDDIEMVVDQARRSAVVTHFHPEGVAGAIAVAVAAALAGQWREQSKAPAGKEFMEEILPWVPESETRTRIRKASEIPREGKMDFAVSVLGNGTGISAQDTVPLVIWCAAHNLDNFTEALWHTVSALGDRDTTCAMVGGIVAVYVGDNGVPDDWQQRCEPLPDWPFAD